MNRNIIVNMAGRAWSSISTFIFIPLYIRLLGVDSFSVISFSAVVAGVLMILDGGLSATISREMARADVSLGYKYRSLRAFEKIYILVVIACGVVGVLLSDLIARDFIQSTPIDRGLVALCLKLVAVEAGFQICLRFYIGAMMGLERQIEANLFVAGWGTARNGLVILLMLVAPTLSAFFFWQLIVTVLLMVLAKHRMDTAVASWRPPLVPIIDVVAIKRVRAFAAGIFLVSIVAAVNTQLDKVVLSRLFSLDYVGYYNIAVSIGAAMLAISSPLQSSIQPRLTTLFSDGRVDEAGVMYTKAATLVSIFVFPLMAIVSFNAEEVLMAWTGNALIAEHSGPIVPWMAGAYALLSIQTMAYGVALANGYTRYNNLMGLGALTISIPGYWLAVGRFGAVGAAGIFMTIQFLASTFLLAAVDQRFLRIGIVRTYAQLLVVPALTAILLAYAMGWIFSPVPSARGLVIVYVLGLYLVGVVGTAIVTTSIFRMRWNFSDLTAAS